MVGMVLLEAAGGLVVVSVVVLFALRRRGGDGLHSVDGYRKTLTTLQDVRSRSVTGSSVRILGSSATAEAPERPARVLEPPAPVGARSLPEGRGLSLDPASRGVRSGLRRKERAIAQMSRRPRRLGAPLAAAVVVIAAVTGLAIAGAHSRTPPHHSTTGTTAPKNPKHKQHTRPPPTTTTTFPSSFVASGTTSSSATYSVPNEAYSVKVTASGGECWVEVTNSAGTNVVAEVLPEGQEKTIPLTGDARVVLGAPSSVTVQVDQSPVVVPGGISELLFDTPPPLTTTTTAA
jgi:hypothetical protein